MDLQRFNPINCTVDILCIVAIGWKGVSESVYVVSGHNKAHSFLLQSGWTGCHGNLDGLYREERKGRGGEGKGQGQTLVC